MRATVAAAPPAAGLPAMTRVADECVAGPNGSIPVRIYEPCDMPKGTLVYCHAGGWVIGDLDFADNTCRRIAGLAGCRLVSVDYRKAPEHPWPAALDDVSAVLGWAATRWGDPLAIGGESAGGNLAAAAAIRARDYGGPSLVGQWLAYPVTDHAGATESFSSLGDRNWLLSAADMRWFWEQYCPAGIDRDQPLVSPLRIADAFGLPPAMIVVAQLDPLRDEGLAYAARLAADGVPVTTRCDPAMVHGYLGAAGALPEAAEAVSETARWLAARFA
jgi:acetyl esterase